MASDVEKAREELASIALRRFPNEYVALGLIQPIEALIRAVIAEEREKSFKIKPEGGDAPSTPERRDPATYSPAAGESATSSGDGAGPRPVAWRLNRGDLWWAFASEEEAYDACSYHEEKSVEPLYSASALRAAHVAGMREAAEMAQARGDRWLAESNKQTPSEMEGRFQRGQIVGAFGAAGAIRAAADAKEREGGRANLAP